MNKLSVYTIGANSNASKILDLIRFLSAVVVFLFHFYIPLPGYQAVMIFFILSGYFISSSVLKLVKENRWNWFDYILKRLIRLWIVLIPGLLLTLLWAKIQFSLFGESNITNYLNWKIFLGNLFFLQGIKVPQYGLNGPLWSLSYEFWYYLMFPCLIQIIFTPKKVTKIIYSLIFTLILFFVGLKISEYFLVWVLGAIIPLIKPIKFRRNTFFGNLVMVVCFILVLISMKIYVLFTSYPNLQIIPDLCIGLSFSLMFYMVVSRFNNGKQKSTFNLPKYLAGFSYTLYLTHYPLAHIILTWRASSLWTFAGREALIIKAIIMFSVVLYAWFIALLTENHTERVRKLVYRFINGFNIKKVKSVYVNRY